MKQIDLNEYKHTIAPIKLQITFNYEEHVIDFVPGKTMQYKSKNIITMDFIEQHCRSIKDKCSNIINNGYGEIKAIIFDVDTNIIYIEQLFASMNLFDDSYYYFKFFNSVKNIDVINNNGNEQIYVVIPDEMNKSIYKEIRRKIMTSKFVRYIHTVTCFNTITKLNLKNFVRLYNITINDNSVYFKGVSEGLKSLYEIAFVPNNVIINSSSNKHITELFYLSIVNGPIYNEGCCHIIHKLYKNKSERLRNLKGDMKNIEDLENYYFTLPYRNNDHRLFILMFYLTGIVITSSSEYNSTINDINHIAFSFIATPSNGNISFNRLGNCVWYNKTSLNIFGVNDYMKKYGLINDDNIKYHIFNNLTLHICGEDIPIKELTDVNDNVKLQNILGDALAYRLLHQNSDNLKELSMDTFAIRIWQWFVYLIGADKNFKYYNSEDAYPYVGIFPKYNNNNITFYDFPSENHLEDIRKQTNYEGYNKLMHDEKLQHIMCMINSNTSHCFGTYRIANSNKFQYVIADINFTQSKLPSICFDKEIEISALLYDKSYCSRIDILLPPIPENMKYELVYYDNNNLQKNIIIDIDNYEEIFKFPTYNTEIKVSTGNVIPFVKHKKYDIPNYICNSFYYPYGRYVYDKSIFENYNNIIERNLKKLPENKIKGGNNMNSIFMFMLLALSIIIVIVIVIVIVTRSNIKQCNITRKCSKGYVDDNNL